MKDPSQHLQFPVLSKTGSITFWIKHQKLHESQTMQDLKTLIVATINYNTRHNVSNQEMILPCTKRAELKLPLISPFTLSSKCCR
jgi:hypothetical protein